MENITHYNICKTDCGFYLSRQNNVILFIISLIKIGKMGFIFPKSKEINQDLKKPS